MGCKGPATSQNCPQVQWNSHTNWPIGCGHPCLGCAQPNFWDVMTPFYERLPNVAGVSASRWLDPVGFTAAGAVAAAAVIHGIGEVNRHRRGHRPPPEDKGQAEERERERESESNEESRK
jgi:hydrogenase small subunit